MDSGKEIFLPFFHAQNASYPQVFSSAIHFYRRSSRALIYKGILVFFNRFRNSSAIHTPNPRKTHHFSVAKNLLKLELKGF